MIYNLDSIIAIFCKWWNNVSISWMKKFFFLFCRIFFIVFALINSLLFLRQKLFHLLLNNLHRNLIFHRFEIVLYSFPLFFSRISRNQFPFDLNIPSQLHSCCNQASSINNKWKKSIGSMGAERTFSWKIYF